MGVISVCLTSCIEKTRDLFIASWPRVFQPQEVMMMMLMMMIMIPPSPSLTQVHSGGYQASLAQGGSEGMGPFGCDSMGGIKRYQCMDLVMMEFPLIA